MQKALIFFASLTGFPAVFFYVMGKMSQSGSTPGLVDGKLTQCPGKPNCVCSEDEFDEKHYIGPIRIDPDISKQAFEAVIESIQEMGGSIHSLDNSYLAATFKTSFYGFVDDLELRFDSQKNLIHIRSVMPG